MTIEAALLVPDNTPEFGGNWVTAMRVHRALDKFKVPTIVARVSDARPPAPITHVFNANTGLTALQQGVSAETILVTWTGTDVWGDLVKDPGRFEPLNESLAHVVLTKEARDQLLAYYPAWDARLVHVPPGVDAERFMPEGPRATVHHPSLLLVGGGRPIKGTLEAIDLVEAVRTRGISAHLTILGPARDLSYWEKITARARTREWIHIVERVAFDHMPEWYRASDLVINTSEVEGLSNALLEAMATARPIVAHDIAGNRGLIVHGINGWLYGSSDQFVDLVTAALWDPSAAALVGRRGREWVLRGHNARDEASQFLALYGRLS